MKRTLLNTAILTALGLGAASPVAAQVANLHTVEISLCAGEYDIPANTRGLNNPEPIRMWGYALGEADANGCVNTPSSPGPSILIPNNSEDDAGIYDLQIKLYNALPRATSLVLPGTIKPMTPVMFTAPDNTVRVHSFDMEVAPGQNGVYSWSRLPHGSYIYQSGTHQQVQVQMGLYGAIMNDAFSPAPGNGREAYPGLVYSALYPLIYSEIDPVIHAGVAAGAYNTSDMKSTVDYAPKYFGLTLDTINTSACPQDTWCVQENRLSSFSGDEVDLNIANGSSPIFRLFNGSTRIHTPTLIGGNFDVIAEDGKLYPNLRRQYAVALPPLKTKDAILDTSAIGPSGGTIRLTDSAMNLSNPAPDATGVISAQAMTRTIANGEDTIHAQINVSESAGYSAMLFDSSSPLARRDHATVSEGDTASINVLENDDNASADMLAVVTRPRHGTLVRSANGWNYSHDGSEQSRDSFIYALKQSGQTLSSAAVIIAIEQTNDNPVAIDDSVNLKVGQQIEVRALDNDSDSDSRNLRIVSVDGDGLDGIAEVSHVDKAVTVLGLAPGSGVITYRVDDGEGGRANAKIAVSVEAAANSGAGHYTNAPESNSESVATGSAPVARNDSFSVTEGASYSTLGNPILGVLANDLSNGGKAIVDEYPEHGSIEMNDDGTFEYIHDGSEDAEDKFAYTVYNQWGSDKAEVRIVVTAKMDPPRANDDSFKIKSGKAQSIDVLDNDKDRDSEVRKARIEIVSPPQHGALSVGADNWLTYTPDGGFTGKDQFTYRLYDDKTGEASRRDAKVKLRVR
jgi:hypothetical protein